MLHKPQPGLSEARPNPLHIIENEQPDQDESIYDMYDVIDESQMIDTPNKCQQNIKRMKIPVV